MFLVSETIGLEAHHERVHLLAGVGASACGTSERLQLMLMLRATVLIDQLDPATNMFVETLVRRARTIEHAWSESSYGRKAKAKTRGKLSLEEQMRSGGLTRSAAGVMSCLELIGHVRAKAEREGKLQKAPKIKGDRLLLQEEDAGMTRKVIKVMIDDKKKRE